MFPAIASFLIGMTIAGSPIGGGPVARVVESDSARVPVVDVPYDSADGRVLVPATIGGRAITFVLDYVTDSTVLTKSGLAKAGLKDGSVASITLGSSALSGVTIHAVDKLSQNGSPNAPEADGILGAGELTHYDFVFDGTARKVQLYSIPEGSGAPAPVQSDTSQSDTSHVGWLPPGVTPDNCTPMLHDDARFPHRVFFDLHANRAMHTTFIPGARYVNINAFSGFRLGLAFKSPGSEEIDGKALGFCFTKDNCALKQAIGVPLSLGRRHVQISDVPIHIYKALPDQAKNTSEEVQMGLYGAFGRIFVVSYSTGRVCMAYPRE